MAVLSAELTLPAKCTERTSTLRGDAYFRFSQNQFNLLFRAYPVSSHYRYRVCSHAITEKTSTAGDMLKNKIPYGWMLAKLPDVDRYFLSCPGKFSVPLPQEKRGGEGARKWAAKKPEGAAAP